MMQSFLLLLRFVDTAGYNFVLLVQKLVLLGLKLKGYLINDGYADLVKHADKTELVIPGHMVTGKELSNPLMAGSLPKTTLPTQLIVNFLNANQIKYALTVSPTIYTACIKQFWTTLKHKTINDDVRLQALIDGKKVIITEASIRHKLNDAKGTSCLPNAMIFEELAIIGAKTTSWNEFNSTMASAIICLANNQKFIFSKYILDNLKKNLEAGVPFYLFSRFIQIFMNHQIGNMSHHKCIYVNPSLTKKVFANMKRVGTGFSRVVTPLFDTMMVQVVKEVGDLPTAVQDTPIPDAPSSSQCQRKHKPGRKERKERKESEVSLIELPTEDHVPTTSSDPLPSGEDSTQLKELMVLCTNLLNKFLDLENKVIKMKSSYKEKIAELESRVEKLEEENMSLTKELKSFHTKIESPAFKETVVDKEKSSKHGKKITNINVDAEVNLENVYNLDMAHEEIVLSMQDVTDANGKEVNEEMVEVITTTKIIVDEVSTVGGKLNAANKEPVSASLTNIVAAQPSPEIDAERIKAPRKRTRKEKVEKDQTAKKQKVPDDEDDVFVNVAPLSSKSPTIVDYKIYKEEKKEHFQIIRVNGNHQMYLSFSIMLKNFDREDLKVLWKIVKESFKESQPKEVLDVFLWHTLKVMFEHSIEDSV
nr:hypothetical protein [Tanacetum cinerariifolium]